MNGKKARALRREAHNQWQKLRPDLKNKYTVRDIYKQLKKAVKI